MTSGAVARVTLGFLFLYHGLVPKILFLSPTEILMIQAHNVDLPHEAVAVGAGIAEVLLGLALIMARSRTWPVTVALVAFLLLLLDVALFSPQLLVEAFNPVSTNIAAIGLCIIALIEHRKGLAKRTDPKLSASRMA